MELAIIVGVLVALAILTVFLGTARSWDTEDERLQDYVSQGSIYMPSSLRASTGKLVQGFDKILRSISVFDNLAHALWQADLRFTVTEFILVWILIASGAGLVGFLISGHAIVIALSAGVGMVLPYGFLRFRQGSRLQAFNRQLGSVLMQLSGAMRSGYGLLQAIDYVAREIPAPAGPEFAQVVRDVKLGRSLMMALDDMTERVGSDDLMLIVTAIRIQHETGGNLSEILETVAGTIRERVRLKGELNALTAQQRYSGYVLALLPVIMFFILMIINPEYEGHLFQTGPTLCIPIGALISMSAGFIAIRSILSIEL